MAGWKDGCCLEGEREGRKEGRNKKFFWPPPPPREEKRRAVQKWRDSSRASLKITWTFSPNCLCRAEEANNTVSHFASHTHTRTLLYTYRRRRAHSLLLQTPSGAAFAHSAAAGCCSPRRRRPPAKPLHTAAVVTLLLHHHLAIRRQGRHVPGTAN